jgi:phage gp29-like protein
MGLRSFVRDLIPFRVVNARRAEREALAAAGTQGTQATQKKKDDAGVSTRPPSSLPQGISNELSKILRPQAAYRWLLPSVAAITPQYIEMTLRGALAGNHVQAWELFDLMQDTWPRLVKATNELTNAVVKDLKGWQARPFKEEDEPATDSAKIRARVVKSALMAMRPRASSDENDFGGTVRDIMDGWFKGQVVLETDWEVRNAGKLGGLIAPRCTYWVHPTCVAWDMNGELGLRLELAGGRKTEDGRQQYALSPGVWQSTSSQPRPSQVAPFPDHKFLIGIHKAKSGTALGGALLRSLAWWWCAANFSADWLLNLAQIFGLPLRWANYDPNAPQATVDAICNMLQNMGSAAWAAFPAGTNLEIKEQGKTGDQSPQGDLLDRADINCDLLILGQTLTSTQGDRGSQSLGEVHERVEEGIKDAACDYVAAVINTQLIPSICILNFGDDSEMPQFESASEEEGTLQFKRDVFKNWSTHAVVSAVLANLTDLKSMTRDVGMPVNEEYTDPYVPVEDNAGNPVTGEVRKDSEDDIVGGTVEKPKTEARGLKDLAAKELRAKDAKDTSDESDTKFSDSAMELLIATTLSEFQHINERMAAASTITDPELQKKKLQQALDDLDALEKHIKTDPALATAFYKMLVAGVSNGIAESS